MVLVGYAWVSTESQHVGLQKDTLRKAGCGWVFGDIISGVKKRRQGLDAALIYLREGDALVVWKLDRLGRSVVHLVNIVQGLAARGAGLRVLTEQDTAIDTITTPGKLVFGIFVALAEFERGLIHERTETGLTAATARGRKSGHRPIVTANKLQRARKHIASGLNIREVAARLKVGKTALCTALQSGNE